MNQYKELCEKWRQIFLEMDLDAVVEKLPFLQLTEEHLELNYLGIPHKVSRETGMIYNCKTGEQLEAFNDLMAIYHLFYYACEHPVVSGTWVPFREVKMASVFDQAYQNMILKPFAESFSGKLDILKLVIEELGYEKERYGDISCRIPIFGSSKTESDLESIPCKIELIMTFWDGDDEYPAQANLLFDKQITDFTHPETVVILAEVALSQLLSKAELSFDLITYREGERWT